MFQKFTDFMDWVNTFFEAIVLVGCAITLPYLVFRCLQFIFS